MCGRSVSKFSHQAASGLHCVSRGDVACSTVCGGHYEHGGQERWPGVKQGIYASRDKEEEEKGVSPNLLPWIRGAIDISQDFNRGNTGRCRAQTR